MYKQIGERSPDQPLHLHVTADSQDKVDLAVKRIKEMMISEPLKVLPRCHLLQIHVITCYLTFSVSGQTSSHAIDKKEMFHSREYIFFD